MVRRRLNRALRRFLIVQGGNISCVLAQTFIGTPRGYSICAYLSLLDMQGIKLPALITDTVIRYEEDHCFASLLYAIGRERHD